MVIHQVDLICDATDPYHDLQLAVLESQLQDLYDQVHIHVDHDSMRMQMKITVQFENLSDLIHWRMSQDNPPTLNMLQ